MAWIEIRDPATNHLLARIDPQRNLLELMRKKSTHLVESDTLSAREGHTGSRGGPGTATGRRTVLPTAHGRSGATCCAYTTARTFTRKRTISRGIATRKKTEPSFV
jgi:hypothetical protein